ncbi:hypothetical protein M885DRAFT_577237 [Pelagophyceae sp. CCMP2097]|nr:hypothetical protein M885DRAFT_577237 [Pelagophyceae sp. CCMP2097]
MWFKVKVVDTGIFFVSFTQLRDNHKPDGGGREEGEGGRGSGGDRGCGATGMDVEVAGAGPSSENLLDLTAVAEKPAAFIKMFAKHIFAIQKAGARARKTHAGRVSLAARQRVDAIVGDLIPLLCSQTPAQYISDRLLADCAFAKDVSLVAIICRLCEKDGSFKGALRDAEEIQKALRDPPSLKLHFPVDDMLALRFDSKHCSMECVKRLRLALVGVNVGQVTVAQIRHIYNRRDELFKECGVAVTALDPDGASGNGQCRVADVGALLRKIFEHPKLKKTFARVIFDHSTGTAVKVYFVLASVLADFDGANMTALEGLVLGLMRTLNRGELIDDPYMQQLGPIRNIVDALALLEATGIVVDSVRYEVRWASCNDEKMICLLLCRARSYCFKCDAGYNNAGDCKRPKGFFRLLTIADYEEHSKLFLVAAEAWVQNQEAAGFKATTDDFKSTAGSASEHDHSAWYAAHKGFTGELIMPATMPVGKM